MGIGIKTLAELQNLNILRQFMCNAEDIESEVIDTKPALIVSHLSFKGKDLLIPNSGSIQNILRLNGG